MSSPVGEAMMESYALMVLVMGAFFLYLCGMVWAFSNPKLSGSEDEPEGPVSGQPAATEDFTPLTPLTHSTYVNFWDDSDGLLWDRAARGPEGRGFGFSRD